jgi:HSP20 family molecular chaperone IbpA
LSERRTALAHRRQALVQEQEQAERLWQERVHAQAVLGDLTAFCARVRSRLHAGTFEEKQAILHLLMERVIVGDDTLEIRHVIPLTPDEPAPEPVTEQTQAQSGADPPRQGLRSDGVVEAALPGIKPVVLEVTSNGTAITIHAMVRRGAVELPEDGEAKEVGTEGTEKEKAGTYIRWERLYGELKRAIELAGKVDVDKVEPTYDHGLLTLWIPKIAHATPKRISVYPKER